MYGASNKIIGARDFSLLRGVHTVSAVHPGPYSMGHRGLFLQE
jgi:hypothetical protein